MAIDYRIALTLLAGLAVGAAAVEGLHAQTKPPAYVVIAIRGISDHAAYKTVTEKAPPVVAGAGGKILIASGDINSLDGPSPKRFALIAFDSVEKAQAWYNLPAQKEITAMRKQSTDSLAFIVEGRPN
jgi:uncharacterized protein (DUF1330 family)